jgi:hypothetical protein
MKSYARGFGRRKSEEELEALYAKFSGSGLKRPTQKFPARLSAEKADPRKKPMSS